MRRHRPVPTVLAVTALVIVLAGCVGPTITDDGYRSKTAGTLNDISSALATAKLTIGLELDGRLAFAVTDDLVSQAESDASSAQSSWQTRQPPSDAALSLHDRVEQPIQDAVSALEHLRIAVRQGDPTAIRSALRGLDAPAAAIDRARSAVTG